MPPKPVPLAYAGRKLLGPPEGYGKKKELQVKKWLTSIPASEEGPDVEPSVVTASELDQSLEDLYREVRDSTEGFNFDVPSANGPLPVERKKEVPVPVIPLVQQLNVGGTSLSKPQETAAATTSLGPRPGSTVKPNTAAPTSGGASGSVPAALAFLSSSAQYVALQVPSSSTHPNPRSPGASPAAGSPRDGSTKSSLKAPAQPLEVLAMDDVGPSVLEGLSESGQQALAVAAGVLLARAEAALAARAQATEHVPELLVYKQALLQAARDKQLLAEEARTELVTARAETSATEQGAATQIAALHADVATANQRASDAEAALSRVRAEALQMQQELRAQRMDLDDREDEYKEQISRLQAEVQAMVQRLRDQGDSRELALQKAQEQALTAREQAITAERQYRQLKRQYDLDKAKLEMQVVALQAELSAREQDMARLQRDHQAALAGWQAEVAARIAAEESEKKALKAATKQAGLVESLEQMRSVSMAIKQQSAMAAQRAAALRAPDPAAAVMQRSTVPANDKPHARSAGASGPVGSPKDPEVAASPARAVRPANGRRAVSPGNAQSSSGALKALAQEFEEVEIQRHEQHRSLQRALASERQQLGDALRQQKRALLAVQLQESKQVEEALAVAPEHLRALGLAFRLHLVAAGLPAGGLEADLVSHLSANYRLYIDPATVQAGSGASATPALEVGCSAPMVAVSGALLLLASPGVLTSATNIAAVNEAAVRSCPCHVVAPAQLVLEDTWKPAPGVADGMESAAKLSDQAMQLLKDAWSTRLPSTGPVTAVVSPLSERLGMPDAQLKLLPADALKKLSIDKTLKLPDLVHLNSPKLTHLKLTLQQEPAESSAAAPMVPGSAGTTKAGSGKAGLDLSTLLRALQGNTRLQTLMLKECSTSQAAAIASALASNEASSIHTIIIGTEVPLGALVGKPGMPPLAELDFSTVGVAFGPSDCAVLLEGLRSPAAAARLRSISMPLELSPGFATQQGAQVLSALTAALAALPNLQKVNGANLAALSKSPLPALDLAGQQLGPVAGSLVFSLLQRAGSLTGLTALNLTGSQLGVAGAQIMAKCVEASGGLKSLQMMCLADNQLGPEGVSFVCQAMAMSGSGTAAKVLDLSLNKLGDEGAKALSKHLKQLPGLTCLVLGSNGIQAEGAKALGAGLTALKELRELHLPGNFLGDAGMQAVAKSLTALTAMRSLHLQENYNIAGQGARALGEAIGASTSLQELNLAKNHIGVEGARQIAAGLAASCSLVSLNLEWCKMRAEGVDHISSALKTNKSITRLDLSRNAVGDRGVKGLVEVLERNTTLRRLDLRSNSIGLVGCRLLSTALRERNSTLQSLSMQGNDMEEVVLQALEELATAQRQVSRSRQLDFPANPPRSAASSAQLLTGPTITPMTQQQQQLLQGSSSAGGHHQVTRGAGLSGLASGMSTGASGNPLDGKDKAARASEALAAGALAQSSTANSSCGTVRTGTAAATHTADGCDEAGGNEDEDLEHLLNRYRAPQQDSRPPVAAHSQVPLIDLSYTGMAGR